MDEPQIHDRMPVILPREVEDAWLDPERPREHVVASRLVNAVKNDGGNRWSLTRPAP